MARTDIGFGNILALMNEIGHSTRYRGIPKAARSRSRFGTRGLTFHWKTEVHQTKTFPVMSYRC